MSTIDFIPTVSLDVISLVASSCGYYRGQIEQRQWVRPMGVCNEAQGDVDQRGWAQMKSWFETGMLRTVVQEVFPWTEAKRVQELLARRGVFGKLVMEVR